VAQSPGQATKTVNGFSDSGQGWSESIILYIARPNHLPEMAGVLADFVLAVASDGALLSELARILIPARSQ
jgi:hypothetical protein